MGWMHMFQTYPQRISAVAFCSVVIGHTAADVWGIRIHQNRNQLYEGGRVLPVPRKIMKLCQQVLDDINLTPEEEANVAFYVSPKPWIVSKGSITTVVGGVIGLPLSYNDDSTNTLDSSDSVESSNTGDKNTGFETRRESDYNGLNQSRNRTYEFSLLGPRTERLIDNSKVIPQFTIKHQSVDETSDDTHNLTSDIKQDDITLSDNAKKFAIANEIYGMNNYSVWVENLIAANLFLGGYWLGHVVKLRGGLKLWARVPVYGTIFLSGGLLYYVFTGKYHRNLKRNAAENMTKLGDDYRVAGVEFYEKLARYEKERKGDERLSPWQHWKQFTHTLRNIPVSDRLSRLRELQEESQTE